MYLQPEYSQFIEFKTCLRRVKFYEFDDGVFLVNENLKNDEVLQTQVFESSEAVSFLIELLCGLKSRVVGETEIFGQFKLFYDSLTEDQKKIYLPESFVHFIFTTVKHLRESVVKHWGVKSYGSLIRKMAKNFNTVQIIGTGHLAQELVPWVAQKDLTILSRHEKQNALQKLIESGLASEFQTQVKFQQLKTENIQMADVLIIAAPMATESILALINTSTASPKVIIDCRALNSQEQQSLKNNQQSEFAIINKNCLTIELQELFSELEKEQKKVLENIEQLKNLIIKKVTEYLNRTTLRPQGWDDLWA